MKLITGLKIGDVLAVTNRGGDEVIALELPDGTSYGLLELERMQLFRGTIGANERRDKRRVDNDYIDIIINAINVGLALVAGAELRFKGWCDIRSFKVIEQVYGSDYEGSTEWYADGPRDPAESSSGRVYEHVVKEVGDELLNRLFWADGGLFDDDDSFGRVAILYEIVALQQ